MTWLLILKLSTMTDPVAIGMFYDKSMCELAGPCRCAYVGDDA